MTIREYYEKSYSNKQDNLEEMVNFLGKCNLPRVTQEETENLNRPMISKETEPVIPNDKDDRSLRKQLLILEAVPPAASPPSTF